MFWKKLTYIVYKLQVTFIVWIMVYDRQKMIFLPFGEN